MAIQAGDTRETDPGFNQGVEGYIRSHTERFVTANNPLVMVDCIAGLVDLAQVTSEGADLFGLEKRLKIMRGKCELGSPYTAPVQEMSIATGASAVLAYTYYAAQDPEGAIGSYMRVYQREDGTTIFNSGPRALMLIEAQNMTERIHRIGDYKGALRLISGVNRYFAGDHTAHRWEYVPENPKKGITGQQVRRIS